MSLFREVVGINAFEMAISNVKGKLNEKVNPTTKITSGSQKLGSESGTLEQLLAQQIDHFESSMQMNLKSFMDRSNRVEQTFQEKLRDATSTMKKHQNEVILSQS